MPRMKLLSKPSKPRAKKPKVRPADGPVHIVMAPLPRPRKEAPAPNPRQISERKIAERRRAAKAKAK